MAKTVIGLMDDLGEAQLVVRDLLDAGIAREDIGFLADPQAVPGSAALNESEGGDTDSGVTGGILVTVAADSEPLANTAIGIMKRHGAQARCESGKSFDRF
jgi:hypothetical protein